MSIDEAVVKRHFVTSLPRGRVVDVDECHGTIRVLPAYRRNRRRRQKSYLDGAALTSDNSRRVSYTSV